MITAVVVDNPKSWFIPFARRLTADLALYGEAHLLARASDIPTTCDVTFLLSCERLVPPAVLARSRHNIVVHASDLPRGKGMSPLTWQILAGSNVIPLTLFEAAEAVDAGMIYLKDTVAYQGHELLDELQHVLGEKILAMCRQFIAEYPGIIARGQLPVGPESRYPRRTPADSRLDPHQTIAAQFNLLRVVDNDRYPAFFEWRGRMFVLSIRPMAEAPAASAQAPQQGAKSHGD